MTEYYVHVDFHGVEHRIEKELYGPPENTLHVHVRDGWEVTTVRNVKERGFESFVTVHPRGKGWEMLDASSDNFTTWRRPVGTVTYVEEWQS